MIETDAGARVTGRGMLGDGLSHAAIFLIRDLENRKFSRKKDVKGGITLEDLALLKKSHILNSKLSCPRRRNPFAVDLSKFWLSVLSHA